MSLGLNQLCYLTSGDIPDSGHLHWRILSAISAEGKQTERRKKMNASEELQKAIENREYGLANIIWSAAIGLMDEDIAGELHSELAPCTEAEFLEKYCEAHWRTYGENFNIW